jgi:hypothetical protein
MSKKGVFDPRIVAADLAMYSHVNRPQMTTKAPFETRIAQGFLD